MKKKTLIGMACVMGMVLLAGCQSAGTKGGAEETKVLEKSSNEDTVTLKWIQVGNGMPDNYDAWLAQINPYLEEKIGVNLEVEIVPWGDWDNRRSVIVNSGEYFDILFTDQTRYNAEAATGALYDMTDLLKTKAPQLYDMIPEDYWRAASIGGKIYAVPTYKDSSVTEYFIWDKTKADQYGIDIQEVNSFETLHEALKKMKAGGEKTPYFMSKSGADFLVKDYYDQLGSGLSALGIRYDDNTKTVVNPMEQEDVLKQLDIVHKMYQEGIINGDAPTADDSNKYRTFFTCQGWSGAAASTWGPINGIDNCVAVQYGNTVVSNTSVRGSLNAVYSGCKYPEKAILFLQLVNTDSKVRDLLYYGVEGENFVYTQDGKVDKKNSDWSMAGYTQGTFFQVSQLATDEFNQWDEVRELNAGASPSVMLGFDMDTSSVETELASCRAVYEKYRAEFFTGAREPRELIEVIKKELSAAGWERIREEAQKQVDDWK